MRYSCTEETCSYEGSDRYAIVLKGEMCVDIYNIASIFCPYCQSVMVADEQVVVADETETEEYLI